jgi:hypothetical protein
MPNTAYSKHFHPGGIMKISKVILLAGICLAAMYISLSAQSAQTPGTWVNVTPNSNVATGESGIVTVVSDAARPGDFYFFAAYRGVWKSTDFGKTWAKTNTGTNSDQVDNGRGWYSAIGLDLNRNPATPPVLYTTAGYGSLGVWKSTDGGVSWVDVWNNNIFKEDGVTNIYSDVGRDIHALCMTSATNPNRLILNLHGYSGSGGNNGVFETTNGGQTWIDHNRQTFNFQPHSDDMFPLDSATWIVSHAGNLYRTADRGASWNIANNNAIMGRVYHQHGKTMYASTFGQCVWKSSDNGSSWTQIPLTWTTSNQLISSDRYLYVMSGWGGDVEQEFRRTPFIDDTIRTNPVWENAPGSLAGMRGGAPGLASAYDGANWIFISAQASSGIWRYVEPAAGTTVTSIDKSKINIMHSAENQIVISNLMGRQSSIPAQQSLYDLRGQMQTQNMHTQGIVIARIAQRRN